MTTWWRSFIFVSVVMLIAGACYLFWEKRADRTSPASAASQTDMITMSNVYAGGKPASTLPDPHVNTHEDVSAFDVSEGKRLYKWFNCVTCHASGGGDIGPALMDEKWLYGAAPRNIFASIVEGRPNGMPSFRGKIPDAQVWQLVAYTRSMSGQVPVTAASSRDDQIAAKGAETLVDKQPINNVSPASPDRRSNTK